MKSHPAFTRHDPAGTVVPLVLDSPHSGTEYPADFQPAQPMAALRQAEDSFVDELFGTAPAHGATLIAARFPRSYIDPNRSILDIDTSLLDAPWPGPAQAGRKTQLGIGLIWRIMDTGEAIYARKLSIDEVKRRITEYHQPYQKAVQEALDAAYEHFGTVYHVNCHSMPALSSRVSEDGPGKPRADFVLGDRDGTTCSAEFTALVAGTLRGLGYEVKVNDPYKGVELVRAFSDPQGHRHSLQVEVNRRLYMDEQTREKNANFPVLRDHLDRLVHVIAEFAAERSHACLPAHGHRGHVHGPECEHDHDAHPGHDHGHHHGHKH